MMEHHPRAEAEARLIALAGGLHPGHVHEREPHEECERDDRMSAHASRLVIREAIAKRYTLPVDEASGVVDD